ncbi:hypothetical protein [Candidatus Frankia nodulisporulans]|uniref:hypothetical protein n=1 Tax=Candidatus Frankia nodulisporulans TaxID=2060052 RepID=UPI001584035A|nr:hypothetical protein [Candidatus Frankia nodulisporulans]
MTLGLSVFLVAVGAALRYALTWRPGGIDLQVLGLILMVAGIATGVICVLRAVLRTPAARENAPLVPFPDRAARARPDELTSDFPGTDGDAFGPVPTTPPPYRDLERHLFASVFDHTPALDHMSAPGRVADTASAPLAHAASVAAEIDPTAESLTDDERPTQPGAIDPGWQGSRQSG